MLHRMQSSIGTSVGGGGYGEEDGSATASLGSLGLTREDYEDEESSRVTFDTPFSSSRADGVLNTPDGGETRGAAVNLDNNEPMVVEEPMPSRSCRRHQQTTRCKNFDKSIDWTGMVLEVDRNSAYIAADASLEMSSSTMWGNDSTASNALTQSTQPGPLPSKQRQQHSSVMMGMAHRDHHLQQSQQQRHRDQPPRKSLRRRSMGSIRSASGSASASTTSPRNHKKFIVTKNKNTTVSPECSMAAPSTPSNRKQRRCIKIKAKDFNGSFSGELSALTGIFQVRRTHRRKGTFSDDLLLASDDPLCIEQRTASAGTTIEVQPHLSSIPRGVDDRWKSSSCQQPVSPDNRPNNASLKADAPPSCTRARQQRPASPYYTTPHREVSPG